MFWFGKRKNKEEKIYKDTVKDSDEIVDENDDIDELAELDEIEELEDENLEDVEKIYGSDEDDEDSDESDEDEELGGEEIPDVAEVITSLDMLAEFVTSKAIGDIQFFNIKTYEAFELREAHLRIARVWASVSMAREYPPQEFAKIMLALEVIENDSLFLVLPALSAEEGKQAIIDFCEQKYGENGKKYASNVQKFAKMVNENGDMDEWRSYNKELVYDKLVDFCDEHGIAFDRAEDNSENE